jgi:hypothetical protein
MRLGQDMGGIPATWRFGTGIPALRTADRRIRGKVRMLMVKVHAKTAKIALRL